MRHSQYRGARHKYQTDASSSNTLSLSPRDTRVFISKLDRITILVVYLDMNNEAKHLETPEYQAARISEADRWVPACCGLEKPYSRDGVKILYVYNFATGRHGYLDMEKDIVFETDALCCGWVIR